MEASDCVSAWKGEVQRQTRRERTLELINPQQSSDQAVSCQLCVPKDKIPRVEAKDSVTEAESKPIRAPKENMPRIEPKYSVMEVVEESRPIEKKPVRIGRREQLLELINPQTSPDQKVSCQLCVIKHKISLMDGRFEDEISVASKSGSASPNSLSGVQTPHRTESAPPSSDEDDPLCEDGHREQSSGVFSTTPPTRSAGACPAEAGRIQERGCSAGMSGSFQDLDQLVWVAASGVNRGEPASLPPMQGRLRAVLPTLLRPANRRPDSSTPVASAGPSAQDIVRQAGAPRLYSNV